MFAMFLYLTLYVQNILGYSALEAGLRFLPMTLISFVDRAGVGQARRAARRALVPRPAGSRCVGVGLLLMRGLAPGDDWTALLAGFLVAGGGIGLVNPRARHRRRSASSSRAAPGMASGINSTFRQVGVATGIAAWGAIFQHVVASTFKDEAVRARLQAPRGVSGNVADFVSFGGAQRTGNGTLIRVAETAFDAGLNHILLIAAIVALIGSALCAVLVRPQDFVAHAPAGAPAAAEVRWAGSSCGRRRPRTATSSSRACARAATCTGRGSDMPETPERYAAYLSRIDDPRAAPFLACRTEDGAIVGFLNISEIVRGGFKSAFVGYGGVAAVRRPGLHDRGDGAAAARGVHRARPAPARGQHPAGQPRLDRARRALRLRLRGSRRAT